MNFTLMRSVLSIELRKMFAYRYEFWAKFVGMLIVELVTAYFLWNGIFTSQDAEIIGGYSFTGMITYYLFSRLIFVALHEGSIGAVSEDIYQGHLTKYLIYPVRYVPFKYIERLAILLIGSIQLLVVSFGYLLLVGKAPELSISPVSFLQGFISLLCASLLHFLMSSLIELVAFWADQVWSLLVMFRFVARFLGGGMLPLALFPDWAEQVLQYLPFACIVSFPIRSFLGELDPIPYYQYIGLTIGWCCGISILMACIWNRGLREKYTGVGI